MSEWISVDEKLPNRDGDGSGLGYSVVVDLWVDGERLPDCYYNFDDEQWLDTDIHCEIDLDLVTHWMPLPTPPESN